MKIIIQHTILKDELRMIIGKIYMQKRTGEIIKIMSQTMLSAWMTNGNVKRNVL